LLSVLFKPHNFVGLFLLHLLKPKFDNMTPKEFPEVNFTFQKPKGWTDEQCMPLPVCRTQDAGGNNVIISKWKMSLEELKEVNKTQCVYVMVVGDGTPPLSVYGQSPFLNPKKEETSDDQALKEVQQIWTEALGMNLLNDPQYRAGWQANIAAAFIDATAQNPEASISEVANIAANNFLNNLCK
jgi:hypothetical protein